MSEPKIDRLLDSLFDRDKDEYEKILDALDNLETMDSDEWDDTYESASDLGKEILDDAVERFADNAVGSEHWDSDED